MSPKADKREQIVRAALELFTERGFHGTTVPELAKRAGVGAGTIYRYFESKEALVNALYQEHKAALTGCLLSDFPLDAPWREQLGTVWRRLAAFARENPVAMAFLEVNHHGPYLDETSRAMEEAGAALIKQRLEAARAAQVIKDLPPELLHAMVHGCFVGLLREERAGAIELSDEVVAATEDCIWEAVRR